MVLWQSNNNKKIVEKPLNSQHLHSKTRCSSHITTKSNELGYTSKPSRPSLKSTLFKSHWKSCNIFGKNMFLRLILNGVRNSQVFNAVWGLKELEMSTTYWSDLLFKQCLKPWPNHSQVWACSYNHSSSHIAAVLLEFKIHHKHNAKSHWAIMQKVVEWWECPTTKNYNCIAMMFRESRLRSTYL